MTKTLKSVEEPRVWEGGKYPIAFINVVFEDGTKAYYKAKPDSMEKRHAELNYLVGVPSEFTLEDDGRGGQKITDYPGKPQPQQGGGGGRTYVDNSPSIEAQNALNNAVALVSRYTELYGLEDAIRLVREVAPQLHAVTQNLKNGGSARPSTSAAAQPVGEQGTSLPERSTPAGAADTWEDIETAAKARGRTWADVNAKASGDVRAYGEGSQSSPEPSGGGSEVNRKEPPANGSPPDLLPTEEQWAEALGYDITRARALAILVKAGQPLTSSDEITASQLESLVRPHRDAKARL